VAGRWGERLRLVAAVAAIAAAATAGGAGSTTTASCHPIGCITCDGVVCSVVDLLVRKDPVRDGGCPVSVGQCDQNGHCAVNVGYCADNGECLVNVGYCSDATPVRL
jgi:hypothetical protein